MTLHIILQVISWLTQHLEKRVGFSFYLKSQTDIATDLPICKVNRILLPGIDLKLLYILLLLYYVTSVLLYDVFCTQNKCSYPVPPAYTCYIAPT